MQERKILSNTEENYLKAIYKLSDFLDTGAYVSTGDIASKMETKAASVTDMIKRLASKEMLNYIAYRGVKLTEEGEKVATILIRKHRLWEVFLVEKLNFTWDEVHYVAEQLEHIKSDKLIDRLDDFLGNPHFDPHGDPIPDSDGSFRNRPNLLLSGLEVGSNSIVVGVKNHQSEFLQLLDSKNIKIGTQIEVIEKHSYDQSMVVKIDSISEQPISQKVSNDLFVQLV